MWSTGIFGRPASLQLSTNVNPLSSLSAVYAPVSVSSSLPTVQVPPVTSARNNAGTGAHNGAPNGVSESVAPNGPFRGLHRWSWDRLPINRFFLIVGGTGTGKTVFANDGLFHMRKRIKAMLVMSNTERSDPMFVYDPKKNPVAKLPNCFVYFELNIAALEKAVKRLQLIKSNPLPQVKSTQALCYWDDVLNESKKLNHPIVRHWVWNVRHDGGGLWLLIQYLNDFPKKLRKQPHFMALQRPKGIDDVKEIWTTLCSALCTLEQFQQMVARYTRGYGTLVIDFLAKSTRLEDHFFWYVATPPEKLGPFRIDEGGDMWKYAWFHERDPDELKMNWTRAPWDPNALALAVENGKGAGIGVPGARGRGVKEGVPERTRKRMGQPFDDELEGLQFLDSQSIPNPQDG